MFAQSRVWRNQMMKRSLSAVMLVSLMSTAFAQSSVFGKWQPNPDTGKLPTGDKMPPTLRLTISGDQRTVVIAGPPGQGSFGQCFGTFALDGTASTVDGPRGAAVPGAKPRVPATAKAGMREDALTIDFEQPVDVATAGQPPRRWTCRFSASGTAMDLIVTLSPGPKEIKHEYHWVRAAGEK
jgi:hypothetical protein